MYIRTSPGLGQSIQGLNELGACVVPNTVAVRKLRCTAADLAAISGVVGRPVSAAEARTAITTSVEQAVQLLLNAARPLSRPRPAVGTDARVMLWQHFQDAFAVSPDFVPSWRPAGAQWDRGSVVRERLRCAARILSNGSIRYRCWGPLSCRDFAEPWVPEDWARVRSGELRICLGESFWRAFGNRRDDDLASTILHEALHIYFGSIRDPEERRRHGPFAIAACYERFVLLMNRIELPQYVRDNCASGLPRGDFPLPPRNRDVA